MIGAHCLCDFFNMSVLDICTSLTAAITLAKPCHCYSGRVCRNRSQISDAFTVLQHHGCTHTVGVRRPSPERNCRVGCLPGVCHGLVQPVFSIMPLRHASSAPAIKLRGHHYKSCNCCHKNHHNYHIHWYVLRDHWGRSVCSSGAYAIPSPDHLDPFDPSCYF